MPAARRPSLALAFLALAGGPVTSGCGDDGGDGGEVVPVTLEVGTGREGYEPLEAGQEVPLVRGEQAGGRLNGFHVFMGLALTGVAADEVELVRFRILDADGQLRAEVSRFGDRAGFLGEDGVRIVVAGVQPRIDDCCAVEASDVTLEASARLADGEMLVDSVDVRTGLCDDAGVLVCR